MAMTENGKGIYEQAKELKLDGFFDPYVGNFGFNENQLFENMNSILIWLENHSDYVLMYQDGYDDGICWWLTNFLE